MSNVIKYLFALVFVLQYFVSSVLWAADNNVNQRYIIIHNDLPISIYPVLQVPDNNCQPGSTNVRRIIVNTAESMGIPSGKTVKVIMPDQCFYNAGRLYLFSVNLTSFEEQLNPSEKTIKDSSIANNALCLDPDLIKTNIDASIHTCFTGYAKASYPLDAPAQLVEYTYDAIDPQTGKPSPNPDVGTLMTDIDLSYVDQLYLPVAITLDDEGASRYMGTTLSFAEFHDRVNRFIDNNHWSSFAAYSLQNWKNNVFNQLVNQSYNVPAYYNLFSLINTRATSELYTPLKPTNPQCSVWSGCNGLSGNCCPNDKGVFLACCGILNYMIDNTRIINNKVTNPTIDTIVSRWKDWVSSDKDLCDNNNIVKIKYWPSNSPLFDKKSFCYAFKKTVQFVWYTFSDTAKDCGTGVDQAQCIIQHIAGYNSEELSGKIPESVQAVLRSVPYGEKGKTPQYHYDKWLLFWAPFDSIFNLDPYTRLIHDPREGVNAVAYSFSIDDKYGNYREKATGFIVNAGGNTALLNKESYDPYEQYFINWANGWSHANVCGRKISINKLPGNARIFMWKNGIKTPYCDVTLYADNEHFVKFRIAETTSTVTDTYTGVSGYQVHGIQFADENDCENESSPELKQVCHSSQFSFIQDGDIAYVSLSDKDKPKVNLNVPPAPILSPSNGIKDCTGRTDEHGQVIPCCQPNAEPPQYCPSPYDQLCPICPSGHCECHRSDGVLNRN